MSLWNRIATMRVWSRRDYISELRLAAVSARTRWSPRTRSPSRRNSYNCFTVRTRALSTREPSKLVVEWAGKRTISVSDNDAVTCQTQQTRKKSQKAEYEEIQRRRAVKGRRPVHRGMFAKSNSCRQSETTGTALRRSSRIVIDAHSSLSCPLHLKNEKCPTF